jgi:hypothetical protein
LMNTSKLMAKNLVPAIFAFANPLRLLALVWPPRHRTLVPAENLHLISKFSYHFLLGAVLKLVISTNNCNNFIIITLTVLAQLIKMSLNTYSV